MEESNETSKKRKLDDVDAEKDDPTILKKDPKEKEQDLSQQCRTKKFEMN